MIAICAPLVLQEGKLEEAIQALTPMIEQSRAEEGNISYQLFQSNDDPNTVMFIEFWKDQEAIDIHGQTEHFQAGIKGMSEFVAEPKPFLHYTLLV